MQAATHAKQSGIKDENNSQCVQAAIVKTDQHFLQWACGRGVDPQREDHERSLPIMALIIVKRDHNAIGSRESFTHPSKT